MRWAAPMRCVVCRVMNDFPSAAGAIEARLHQRTGDARAPG